MSRAFLRRLNQTNILERETNLLGKREEQSFIFWCKCCSRIEIIQNQNAHWIFTRLDRDQQTGNWQTATCGLPIEQQSFGRKDIVTRELDFIHAQRPSRFEYLPW